VLVLSQRPAHIMRDVTIDLPLPRTEETMGTPRFAEWCAELRAMFSPRTK
jgi:NitT/TauT family transport system ATP-binding protein